MKLQSEVNRAQKTETEIWEKKKNDGIEMKTTELRWKYEIKQRRKNRDRNLVGRGEFKTKELFPAASF